MVEKTVHSGGMAAHIPKIVVIIILILLSPVQINSDSNSEYMLLKHERFNEMANHSIFITIHNLDTNGQYRLILDDFGANYVKLDNLESSLTVLFTIDSFNLNTGYHNFNLFKLEENVWDLKASIKFEMISNESLLNLDSIFDIAIPILVVMIVVSMILNVSKNLLGSSFSPSLLKVKERKESLKKVTKVKNEIKIVKKETVASVSKENKNKTSNIFDSLGKTKACHYCGNTLKIKDIFCISCGKKVN